MCVRVTFHRGSLDRSEPLDLTNLIADRLASIISMNINILSLVITIRL